MPTIAELNKRLHIDKHALDECLQEQPELDFVKLRKAYCRHRRNSKGREILFLLSFHEWLTIWIESGHLHQRGRGAGQYVMARDGDRGSYAHYNVQIITVEQNHSDGTIGIDRKNVSDETRRKMSLSHTGKIRGPLSAEHRKKLSIAKIGNKNGVGPRRKSK